MNCRGFGSLAVLGSDNAVDLKFLGSEKEREVNTDQRERKDISIRIAALLTRRPPLAVHGCMRTLEHTLCRSNYGLEKLKRERCKSYAADVLSRFCSKICLQVRRV